MFRVTYLYCETAIDCWFSQVEVAEFSKGKRRCYYWVAKAKNVEITISTIPNDTPLMSWGRVNYLNFIFRCTIRVINEEISRQGHVISHSALWVMPSWYTLPNKCDLGSISTMQRPSTLLHGWMWPSLWRMSRRHSKSVGLFTLHINLPLCQHNLTCCVTAVTQEANCPVSHCHPRLLLVPIWYVMTHEDESILARLYWSAASSGRWLWITDCHCPEEADKQSVATFLSV